MCSRVTQPSKQVLEKIIHDLHIEHQHSSFVQRDFDFSVQAGKQTLTAVAHSKIENQQGRIIANAPWGIQLVPGFVYNARMEGINSKPTWSEAWRNHRVVVPVVSFYEQQNRSSSFEISSQDDEIMYLGGIAVLNQATGKRHIVICTYPSGHDLSVVHARQPVVIRPNRVDDWLDDSAETLTLSRHVFNERSSFKITKDQPLSNAS